MSIRTATMSNSYSSTTRRPGFFRKLVVSLLFVVGIASFMALFETYQKNLSLFWMTVLAVLSIGLASGAVSRIAFYQWSGFTRFFVTLLVLPFGLFVLGVFTNWQMGIGPLESLGQRNYSSRRTYSIRRRISCCAHRTWKRGGTLVRNEDQHRSPGFIIKKT